MTTAGTHRSSSVRAYVRASDEQKKNRCDTFQTTVFSSCNDQLFDPPVRAAVAGAPSLGEGMWKDALWCINVYAVRG